MSLYSFSWINPGCRFLWAPFVLGGLVIAGSASAATCRVTPSGAGNNSGSTWSTAMTLQTALGTRTCAEVWVKAGTYKPTTGKDRKLSFNVQSEVKVYGGFAGNENARDERNVTDNPTILSGDIGTIGDNADNSYHVVYVHDITGTKITTNTILDGFIIRDGNAYASFGDATRGGGLYCNGYFSECSPQLVNIIFSDNSARYGGGAMYNDGRDGTSSPSLTNVIFSGNSAGSAGGAMLNYAYNGTSSPSLTNVTFSGNSARRGGAMYNDGSYDGTSSPSLTNVTFSDNSAVNDGGAMYNDGSINGISSPSLTNVTFSYNSAHSGGAMYNNGSGGGTSRPTLDNVILWDDTTSHSGAEIYNSSATPIVKDSVVQGGCPTDSDCTNVIDEEPLLGPLQDNGGAILTRVPLLGSSAIDAGNNSTCAASDQRGVARPQGPACDIGAVEVIDGITASGCRVDASKPAPGDGLSWATAYPDLQSALHDHDCNEVWVASGTYKPTPGTDRSVSFNVRPGVKVYGGFMTGHRTILSGDLKGDDGTSFASNSDNSYNVVMMDGTTTAGSITNSTVLDGITISGGNANGLLHNTQGGGMFCNGRNSGNVCSPTLRNVTFSGNNATQQGGAMFNDAASYGNSSPSLTNVTFSGNSAGNAGGAMYNDGSSDGTSSPSLTNVTFSDNSATLHGGAIYNDGRNSGTSSPTLDNVILWADRAPLNSSEIYNSSATPTLKNSIVQGSRGSGTDWNTSLGMDGGGNLDADPLLGPLQDNGGATQTMLPGPGSSAIDTGNNSTCPATDQRGVVRPQRAACDIGAVELEDLPEVIFADGFEFTSL